MKNKMKAWRRNSPGNHMGRVVKAMTNSRERMSSRSAIGGLLGGMFALAGIAVQKEESFRDIMNGMIAGRDVADAEIETDEARVA